MKRKDKMLLDINPNLETPLYIQIYQVIKEKIHQKEWQVNDRLPSKRQLADMQGVSENTVMNAYDQLSVEGYIYSEERRGYYVSDVQFHYYESQKRQEVSSLNLKAIDSQTKIKYDLTRSVADKDLFPYSIFQKLYRTSFKKYHDGLLEESAGQGLEALREVIHHYLTEARGVPCEKEQIILGPSSEYLLSLILNLLDGDLYFGIEDPGYPGFKSLMNRHKVPIIPIEVDEAGLRVDVLQESKVNLMCVTSNHQFPTGSIMPLSRRSDLLNWANASSERYIIENDYDSEFRYSGIPIPSLNYLDQKKKVIHLGSFTRVVAPGIRLSYLVLPVKLLNRYNKRYFHQSATLSTLNQWVMYDFIEEGHFERHLNRSRTFYKKKRDSLITLIHRKDPHAKIYGQAAGLHVLVHPSRSFDGEGLQSKLEKDGIKLNLLSDYSVKKEDEVYKNIIFISFSSLSKDEIENICAKIWDYIESSS